MPHVLKSEKCPFIHKPLDDCYCNNLTSKNIDSALYFCNKYFKQCEFYIRKSAKEKHSNGINY